MSLFLALLGFFAIYFSLEDNCFTVLCWFHTASWISHWYTYIPFLWNLPPTPSHTFRLSQSTRFELPTNSHWLSILRGVMYMFQCYFLSLFHPLLPPLCPQVFSLCLCLCSCPANRFISVIFLGFVYTLGFIQWFCGFWFCFFVPARLSAPWDWWVLQCVYGVRAAPGTVPGTSQIQDWQNCVHTWPSLESIFG